MYAINYSDFFFRALDLFIRSSFETRLPPLSRRSHSASAFSVKKGFSRLDSVFASVFGIKGSEFRFGLIDRNEVKDITKGGKGKGIDAKNKGQQYLQKPSITSSIFGIRASNVINLPSTSSRQAIFKALVFRVNPMKRMTLYLNSPKNCSSAKEYPSITSSISFVVRMPRLCDSDKLNRE